MYSNKGDFKCCNRSWKRRMSSTYSTGRCRKIQVWATMLKSKRRKIKAWLLIKVFRSISNSSSWIWLRTIAIQNKSYKTSPISRYNLLSKQTISVTVSTQIMPNSQINLRTWISTHGLLNSEIELWPSQTIHLLHCQIEPTLAEAGWRSHQAVLMCISRYQHPPTLRLYHTCKCAHLDQNRCRCLARRDSISMSGKRWRWNPWSNLA